MRIRNRVMELLVPWYTPKRGLTAPEAVQVYTRVLWQLEQQDHFGDVAYNTQLAADAQSLELAEILFHRGRAHEEIGESSRALADYDRVIDLLLQLNFDASMPEAAEAESLLARTALARGVLLQDGGDVAAAKADYERACAISEQAAWENARALHGLCHAHLGNIALDSDDAQTAVSHYATALPLLRRSGRTKSWLLFNYARGLFAEGNAHAALLAANRALRQLRWFQLQLQDVRVGLAEVYHLRSFIWSRLGERNHAMRDIKRATRIFQRLAAANDANVGIGTASAHWYWHVLSSQRNRPKAAFAAASKAIDFYWQLENQLDPEDTERLGDLLHDRAHLLRDRHRYHEALTDFDAAVTIRRTLTETNSAHKSDLGFSLYWRGITKEDLNQPESGDDDKAEAFTVWTDAVTPENPRLLHAVLPLYHTYWETAKDRAELGVDTLTRILPALEGEEVNEPKQHLYLLARTYEVLAYLNWELKRMEDGEAYGIKAIEAYERLRDLQERKEQRETNTKIGLIQMDLTRPSHL